MSITNPSPTAADASAAPSAVAAINAEIFATACTGRAVSAGRSCRHCRARDVVRGVALWWAMDTVLLLGGARSSSDFGRPVR
jgi:hypothetical protein